MRETQSPSSPSSAVCAARRFALVGAGSFAQNVNAVLAQHGFELQLVVDEFRREPFLGAPVLTARELAAEPFDEADKFLVGISIPAYAEAAVQRLLAAGVSRARILVLAHDSAAQILGYLLRTQGERAVQAILSDEATSMPALERLLLGQSWDAVWRALDPRRKTLAVCCYGKGGGFRHHVRTVTDQLAREHEVVVLTDDDVETDDIPHPVLFMSNATAMALEQVDVALTANCHPCSGPGTPRVSFMHMIYDFILDVPMLVDFARQADPHYIVCPSRASLEWFRAAAQREGHANLLCLVPGGYARLDENIEAFQAYEGPVDSIIYAPTPFMLERENSELTYSMPYAQEFLEQLLVAFPTHRIIVRPHPFDMQVLATQRTDERAQVLAGVARVCERNPRAVLDQSKLSYMESYSRSAVMISDTSSTAFTYAFSTGRPVVFYAPRDAEIVEVLGEFQYIRDRREVGSIARSPGELISILRGFLADSSGWRERIESFRDRQVFNVGRSSEYFVENFQHVLSGERHPDWVYLEGD